MKDQKNVIRTVDDRTDTHPVTPRGLNGETKVNCGSVIFDDGGAVRDGAFLSCGVSSFNNARALEVPSSTSVQCMIPELGPTSIWTNGYSKDMA